MDSFRKWFYRPRRDDPALLAQFYYADEELNLVASELDTFDGSKDPERCTALVNQLRHCQDKVVSLCMGMMEDVIPGERANRDFRAKFPDDVMQDNLAGQLWFGAECLAAGSSILNRESESSRMRPLAKAVTKTIETVRNLLREQCLKPVPEFTEKIRESLKIFDRLFSEFELSYVSAMVPVKSAEEHEVLQSVVVLFSETLHRALVLRLVTQDQVDDCDPALMFTIPRLAIVAGLLLFPHGPLNLDQQQPRSLSHLFRPFRTLLGKIRELLWTLSSEELAALEKSLCSLEEPQHSSLTLTSGAGAAPSPFNAPPSAAVEVDTTTTPVQEDAAPDAGPAVEVVETDVEPQPPPQDVGPPLQVPLAYARTAYTSNFIQSFLARHPRCRTLAADTSLLTQADKRPSSSRSSSERKRDRDSQHRSSGGHRSSSSRTRLRQERLCDRFLAKLTGVEERPRARRRSKRSSTAQDQQEGQTGGQPLQTLHEHPTGGARGPAPADAYTARRLEYLKQQENARRRQTFFQQYERLQQQRLGEALSPPLLHSFREAVEPPPGVPHHPLPRVRSHLPPPPPPLPPPRDDNDSDSDQERLGGGPTQQRRHRRPRHGSGTSSRSLGGPGPADSQRVPPSALGSQSPANIRQPLPGGLPRSRSSRQRFSAPDDDNSKPDDVMHRVGNDVEALLSLQQESSVRRPRDIRVIECYSNSSIHVDNIEQIESEIRELLLPNALANSNSTSHDPINLRLNRHGNRSSESRRSRGRPSMILGNVPTSIVCESEGVESHPYGTAVVNIGDCVSSAVAADPSILGPHNLYQHQDLPAPDYPMQPGQDYHPEISSATDYPHLPLPDYPMDGGYSPANTDSFHLDDSRVNTILEEDCENSSANVSASDNSFQRDGVTTRDYSEGDAASCDPPQTDYDTATTGLQLSFSDALSLNSRTVAGQEGSAVSGSPSVAGGYSSSTDTLIETRTAGYNQLEGLEGASTSYKTPVEEIPLPPAGDTNSDVKDCKQNFIGAEGDSSVVCTSVTLEKETTRGSSSKVEDKSRSDPSESSSSSGGSSSDGDVLSEDELNDEVVALALQESEVAAAWRARARFSDPRDLIQRLFVCISGVADQLQTNYASDLRRILKTVFLLNQTSAEEDDNDLQEAKKEAKGLTDQDGHSTSNDSESLSVESAEDALAGLGSSQPSSPRRFCRPTHSDTPSLPPTICVPPSVFNEHALLQFSEVTQASATSPSDSTSPSISSAPSPLAPHSADLFSTLVTAPDTPPSTPVGDDPLHRSSPCPAPAHNAGSRRSVEEPPCWVPDQEAPRCMACGAAFTVLRRRHHCRNCGKVFCGGCSQHAVPLTHYGIWKPVRVCNMCFLQYVNAAAAASS